MIDLPYLEIFIGISIAVGIGLTLFLALKLKRINPNLYYENRIVKNVNQKVLDFNLIFTLVGWGFAFGAASFAIFNLSYFMLFNEWLTGDAWGKFFISTAIAAGILFYLQKSYFFIKDARLSRK